MVLLCIKEWLKAVFGYTAKYQEGFRMGEKTERERRNQQEKMLQEEMIGKKIIACPNEWEDMVIGVIECYMNHNGDLSSIPVVKDVLTGRTLIVFSPFVPYSRGMLGALLKLNPLQRYSVIIGRHAHSADQYIFDKEIPRVDLMDHATVWQKVTQWEEEEKVKTADVVSIK